MTKEIDMEWMKEQAKEFSEKMDELHDAVWDIKSAKSTIEDAQMTCETAEAMQIYDEWKDIPEFIETIKLTEEDKQIIKDAHKFGMGEIFD